MAISPEEIQKEFEDFVKKRFGDRVHVIAQKVHGPGEPENDFNPKSKSDPENPPIAAEKTKKDHLDFNFRPREIKEYLDRFVVQQEAAKRALAIAVCDHYNYVRELRKNPAKTNDDYAKQNVMVLGPTGVGKTYLVRQIAKLIGVPFVKADATRFSETGYVGANVDDLIHDLVAQAQGDLRLAEYGIVYLDEADKLAGSSENARSKDVNGRGVQFGLLKLMEETEVDLRAGNDMRSQMQAFLEYQRKGKMEARVVNTRHILFIVSGSFHGLNDVIKQRLDENSIGFNRERANVDVEDDYLQFATTEDFIKYGFEPEFIGRLPVRVACKNLGVDDLFHVLKDSEASIIKQYKSAFAAYGIDADFRDDALWRIAELAAGEQTGARGLMTVCEKALRDFKYELPSLGITHLVVNRMVIDQPQVVLQQYLERYTPIVHAEALADLQKLATAFQDTTNSQSLN